MTIKEYSKPRLGSSEARKILDILVANEDLDLNQMRLVLANVKDVIEDFQVYIACVNNTY